ncbi:unnamed protein product [Anisakis simplex]|uniref:ABC2_membrane domain-containing protein n=1 Tax=Anisakis simplex TaxID=6269 RepID=A0A0M3JWU8_ANISI|nr:unnamed protein product [Anisakis simplex]
MRYLIWRSFLTTVRNPVLLRVRLFQTVVSRTYCHKMKSIGKQLQIIGVLIGLVYLGTSVQQSTILNINGVLFTLVCNMNYLFQFVVVEVFCVEMPIFLREHANGLYRTDTYFIAKNLAEAPQYIALPLLFTSILYWMAGLAPVVGAFALCCLINVLMANTAISIGYAASCIFEDISVAISVMPAFVLPAMAFAGFFINQDTLPIYFIYLRFLSYFGYAYESLVINEWSHVDYIPGCANRTTCLETGADVIESLSFNADNLYPDILALLIMTIIIRVIAFIALYIRASRRK